VLEECKENLAPAQNCRSKKPRLVEQKPHNSAVTSLQEQIEREYKMRDGAAKLLQASKSTRQSMEASKGLFVSNAKIIALMRELQQRQSGGGGNSGTSNELRPCNAKLAISGRYYYMPEFYFAAQLIFRICTQRSAFHWNGGSLKAPKAKQILTLPMVCSVYSSWVTR